MDENPLQETNITSRDVLLVLILSISTCMAIFIVIWSQEPDYRPLVQDMRLVDAVKVVDVLEQKNISYHADIRNHILYVEDSESQEARLHLARIGVVIEYPGYEDFGALPEACLILDDRKEQGGESPIWQQPWFLKVVRLMMGGLVLIVLILSVIRPMLKQLIYPEYKE